MKSVQEETGGQEGGMCSEMHVMSSWSAHTASHRCWKLLQIVMSTMIVSARVYMNKNKTRTPGNDGSGWLQIQSSVHYPLLF